MAVYYDTMKTGLSLLLPVAAGVLLLQAGCAQHNPATERSATAQEPALAGAEKPTPAPEAKPAPAAVEKPAPLTSLEDKAGYGIGMDVGRRLKQANYDVNLDELMAAIKDELAGREPKMSQREAQEAINAYAQQIYHERLERDLKEGEAFLAANKEKEGVKTQTVTLPDGKTAEFQYQIIKEGTGETPGSNDTVTVNYRGTLIDGTEFDSSYKRGHPAKFMVKSVIRGWSEALQMMKVGSEWKLFIPASLGYGERNMPGIGPGSTIIFDVELLGVEAPKPVTSDIIRVPSAEEMKAGAKIEVIKAEDLEKKLAAERAAQAATNNAAGEKK
jgi:FKBP-type peptidyl-prolyl cis-trans isomerase FklB